LGGDHRVRSEDVSLHCAMEDALLCSQYSFLPLLVSSHVLLSHVCVVCRVFRVGSP
jgi:hypothetical protein